MWKSIDDAPVDAGDVGGDIQRGTAWSRRFVWSDEDGRPLPVSWEDNPVPDPAVFAIIEETWYAVDVKDTDPNDVDAAPIVYDIQNRTEFMLCTNLDDIGGTEEWRDYEYRYEETIGYSNLERADQRAHRFAAYARNEFGKPNAWG